MTKLLRVKQDFSNLINKILDKIPADKLIHGIVLDPEMGGGQFMREVERRKREAGLSEEKIRDTCYGFLDNQATVNYIYNKYKLVGTYIKYDLIRDPLNMKFDVVVGNPPYDAGKTGSEGKVWPLFIDKSFELLKQGGWCSLVTPTSWTSGSKTIVKGRKGVLTDIFAKNNILEVELDCKDHFPNVSTSAGYFIGVKEDNKNNTKFYIQGEFLKDIDLTNTSFIPFYRNEGIEKYNLKWSILQKVYSHKSFNVLPLGGAGSRRKDGVNEPTVGYDHKHYVRGGSFDKNIMYAWFKEDQNPRYSNSKKVIMPLDGGDTFKPYIDMTGEKFAVNSYVILLEDNDAFDGVVSVFYSKLFKFLVQEYRTSGFIPYDVVKHFPKLEMSNVWEPNKLYEKFGFSESEIQFIEGAINCA